MDRLRVVPPGCSGYLIEQSTAATVSARFVRLPYPSALYERPRGNNHYRCAVTIYVRTCKQKEVLAAKYQEWLRICHSTVREMERARAVSDVRRYMDVRSRVESTEVKCTIARLNVQRHIEEHRCGRSSDISVYQR